VKQRRLLSVESEAFTWMLRTPTLCRLHELFAAYRGGSEINGYRVRSPARNSVAAHP